jgi:hypothetical protein
MTKMKNEINVIHASGISTSLGLLNDKQINSHKYAQRDRIEVMANTLVLRTFFGSETDGMHTAEINSRLNAADPTIVDGPSSPAGFPRLLTVSSTESNISGADDPRAIRVKFATVAFHLGTSTNYFF